MTIDFEPDAATATAAIDFEPDNAAPAAVIDFEPDQTIAEEKPAVPTSNVLANMGRSMLGGIAGGVADILGGAAGFVRQNLDRGASDTIAHYQPKIDAILAKKSLAEFSNEQLREMTEVPPGYRTVREEFDLQTYQGIVGKSKEHQDYFAKISAPVREFQKLSSEASKEAQTFFGQDPARQDEFLSKLATGAGSLPPYIASSIAGGPVASMMIGALQTGQNEYNAAIEAGKPELADEAMVKGMGIGLTEGAGVGGGLGEAAKGFAAKALVTLKKAFEEGGQEWVQQTLSNLNASTFTGYKPNQPTFKGSGEAFAIGAILGGGVEGVGQVIRKDPVLAAVAPATAAAVARTQPVTVTVPEVAPPPLPSGRLGPPDPLPKVFEKPPLPTFEKPPIPPEAMPVQPVTPVVEQAEVAGAPLVAQAAADTETPSPAPEPVTPAPAAVSADTAPPPATTVAGEPLPEPTRTEPSPVATPAAAVPEVAAPAAKAGEGEVRSFAPDDTLIMHSPHTGEDVKVNYRGPLGDKSVVVMNGHQMSIPTEWLRHQNQPLQNERTRPTGTRTESNQSGAMAGVSQKGENRGDAASGASEVATTGEGTSEAGGGKGGSLQGLKSELSDTKDRKYRLVRSLPPGAVGWTGYESTKARFDVLDARDKELTVAIANHPETIAAEKASKEVAQKKSETIATNQAEHIASLPVFQRRNGWEIVVDFPGRYVLRDPFTKEDIYAGKLSRVRKVADESKPKAASTASSPAPAASQPTPAAPAAPAPAPVAGTAAPTKGRTAEREAFLNKMAASVKAASAKEGAMALPASTPSRVQLRSGPATYSVVEQLAPQKGDQPGEVYFRVKNERTGEEQTVEAADMKPVKAMGAKGVKAAKSPDTGTQGGASTGSRLAPSASSSAPVVPVKAMSEIIRDIAKGLDIPIRFGRLTTNKFAGYFKKVQNLIGAKTANDIEIVSHEAGHKLDDTFGFSKNKAIRAELDKLGDPATPDSRSSWTKKKTLKYKYGEGVAEFVRHWLTDPARALTDAPATAKYFGAVMDANPDFGDTMRAAQADVQNWRNAPAEARLASSISVGSNPNGTPYRLPQLTRDLVDDLHMLRMAVDDAEKFSGERLPPSDNPYLLARNLRGSYGMADNFIQNGVADFKTRKVTLGTSLEDALKPVAGRINEFRHWIVAKRAQELHSQGRETGLVKADVDFVANKYDGEAAFQKAFQDVKKWNDALLQYAVDSGYVSKEGADAMRKMNQDYVPFHRVFEIGAGEMPSQSATGAGRGLNVGKAGSLKRLTGSARDIVDPLETMIKNAYVLITASEKSAINRSIGDMAQQPGMGRWVEKVATPREAVKVDLDSVREQLEDAGADLTGVPDDLALQFFRASGRAPFGENIIKVTTGGNTTFYRLKSDLFDAFHALDLEDNSRLIQMLSQPAQLLRAGVTLDPAFALANVMRDAFGSAVINRHGMLPFEATARGVMALLNNPKLVAEWAASGGAQSFEAHYFDRKKMEKFMRERITKDLTPVERALIIAKSPLTALRWISGASETATRIGEFEQAYKANIKAGMSEGDARRMASYESRDRQDFAKGGAKTKILRQMAAFWNASLQGNVTLYRAFKDRPLRTTLQGMAYITLPTIALMAINYDDEDYWDRPQWERDGFWLVPIGKDDNNKTSFLRIPKPFLPGLIFGMLPERMMTFARTDDKKAFDGAMKRIAADVIPNPMPQTAQIIVSDILTGKQGWDLYRDRPVVPDSLADLPPELQWTEQTSLTAKKIGATLGFSPMKVDHIIAGTAGGLGRQVVHNVIDQTISAMTGEKPTATNVVPGARFVTTPAGISSQSVETFYEQITKLREQREAVKVTGKPMDGTNAAKLRQMERAATGMSRLRAAAKVAKTPQEKQKRYLEIADLARKHIK